MKTLEQIINQEPVFLNHWAESKEYGVIAGFEGVDITKEEYEAAEFPMTIGYEQHWLNHKAKMDKAIADYQNVNILFASYGQPAYEGYAWVLFAENGELFEVCASHCSCYGLEGQWEQKEPVVLEELKNRLQNGTFGSKDYTDNLFAEELKVFLGI